MLENVQGQVEGVQYLQRVVDGTLTIPLLLLGPSGTGRRFSILEAAKEMVKADESQVFQINGGIHPDVMVVEPEKRQDLKAEAVRRIIEKTKFKPARAKVRFLILDGIDKATPAASNALLKVLEEAPDHIRFFLLAEDLSAVLPTIRSRCTSVRYRRLSEKFIQEKLRDHTENDARALVCSRLAEGSIGRAIYYLNSGKLPLRDKMLGALSEVARGDLKALFATVDSVSDDLSIALPFLEHLLHDLIMIPHNPTLLTNTDKADALGKLRGQLGDQKIQTLISGLRGVQSRATSPINLSFHIKTALSSAF